MLASWRQVLFDGFKSPVLCCELLFMIWIWVKLFLQQWDMKWFSQSWIEIHRKYQYWRCISSPHSYSSLMLLIFDLSVMWNFRFIEQEQGSVSFLRGTVLLIGIQACLQYYPTYILTQVPRVNAEFLELEANSPSWGASGLILGWLSFTLLHNKVSRNFILFGVLNFSPSTAPMVMAILYWMVLPYSYSMQNITGLFSGILLSIGMNVFSEWFWAICFFVNVCLVVVASILYKDHTDLSYDEIRDDPNIISVIEVGSNSTPFYDVEQGLVTAAVNPSRENDASDSESVDEFDNLLGEQQ